METNRKVEVEEKAGRKLKKETRDNETMASGKQKCKRTKQTSGMLNNYVMKQGQLISR